MRRLFPAPAIESLEALWADLRAGGHARGRSAFALEGSALVVQVRSGRGALTQKLIVQACR